MLESHELNDLRQRVLRGEQIPHEKYKEVVASLRRKRAEDLGKSEAKKAERAKKSSATTDEELNKILGL